MRDLTKTQLMAKLVNLGFKPSGFFGYCQLPQPCEHISVCSLNAGPSHRAQLAYLVREFERAKSELKP